MANKRMFSKVITRSDDFLDLPAVAQALYFQLGMEGDDDGFLNNPRTLVRSVGATTEDLQTLVEQGYLLQFDGGIIAITHWRVHNTLQNDRYKPTQYQLEKALLSCENGVYQLHGNKLDTDCIQDVSSLETQRNLTKPNLTKVNVTEQLLSFPDEAEQPENQNSFRLFQEIYNQVCTNLPKCTKITSQKRMQAIDEFRKDFSLGEFRTICEHVNQSDYHTGGNNRRWKANFDWLLDSDHATQMLELEPPEPEPLALWEQDWLQEADSQRRANERVTSQQAVNSLKDILTEDTDDEPF